MLTRERPSFDPQAGADQPQASGVDGLERARATAGSYYSTAAEAIESVFSGVSEDYLESGRQQGGQ